jgi:RNA polymerase primary sigma factor
MIYLANRQAAKVGLQRRAEELAKLELEYLFDESFKRRGAEAQMLRELDAIDGLAAKPWEPGKQMPAHLASLCERKLLSVEEERHRFRRMNFAKYRADLLRRKLNPLDPDCTLVERIEFLIGLALRDRNEIVSANTRLVISIVKKFVGVLKTFDELLSEGIETLLRATEKFDYSRGFRFSTYSTTAVRRTLWRSLQTAQRDRDRMFLRDPFEITDQPQPQDALPDDDRHGHQRRQALQRLLRRLSQRERFILSRRYGLGADGASQTLQSLARDLGVCKERVRQLEVRAKAKIRVLAEELNLVFDDIT